jgi:hypothetical protein
VSSRLVTWPGLDQPLHVGRPNLGSEARFLELVQGIFDRRWLTNNGPLVIELRAPARRNSSPSSTAS